MGIADRRMWPHLSEDEEGRRRSLADALMGTEVEGLDDAARAVMSLYALVYWDGTELYLYANASDWPYGGSGSSWLSWKLCDMKDLAPNGSWVEGEASELGTERSRFEALVESEDLNLWQIMAANPGCPGDLIDRMVRVDEVDYDHEQVRFCAAHNPATPPSTLAWLIDRDYTPDEESESEDDDPDTDVRIWALGNPATPVDVLRHWSDFRGDPANTWDGGWQERARVAGNWAVPIDVMQVLATDSHPMVRRAVAANPCCPVDLLEVLSMDHDEQGRVAAAVLANPSSSERARTQAALSKP